MWGSIGSIRPPAATLSLDTLTGQIIADRVLNRGAVPDE